MMSMNKRLQLMALETFYGIIISRIYDGDIKRIGTYSVETVK